MPQFNSETGRAAGKKGGPTTKRRHGLAHFSKVGKKGARIRWQNKSKIREGR